MWHVCADGWVMNPRLLELREQRGALLARCAIQRGAMAEHGQAVAELCEKLDQVRSGTRWVKRNPGVVGALVAGLVILKPSRAWRWGKRGLLLWQGWRSLRQRFFPA